MHHVMRGLSYLDRAAECFQQLGEEGDAAAATIAVTLRGLAVAWQGAPFEIDDDEDEDEPPAGG